ncbi:TetR/AcrR family transcriptional regulator [Micromonospora sp. LOL_025]|uniref:TetR/AcrR family transcriptional regulator n=1 Tax=Micromonospora sp. LOL_025 TaxID=3345413 RepID=UPI003A8BF053
MGLTRSDVVAAAMEIVRTDGVAKLSMRNLAGALGIQAPTLYHHVHGKAALLDLISAEAFRSLNRPEGAYDQVTTLAEWVAALRRDVVLLRDLYRLHPGLARTVVDHARMKDTGLRNSNFEPPELAALIRLGVPREPAQRMIEAAARWTMSALASEDSVADTLLRDRLFHDGLNLLLLGMERELESRTAGYRP